MSGETLNKYLTNLKYKEPVRYANREYSIEDEMLKTLLKYEKEVYGIYPI